MARAVAQPRNDVYTGMLILICVSMLVGIFALILEAGDYDWVQKAPTSPSLSLPKSEPLPEPGAAAGVGTAIDPTRGPVTAAPESGPLAPRAGGSDTARGASGPQS